MESNIIDHQSWGSDSTLSQPHFDEKATLLSAQPVVPISSLSVKPRFSRKLLFGFALLGMLFLGMAATSLYYSQFIRTESPSISGTETVSSGIQGFTSDSVGPVERPKEPSAPTRSAKAPGDSDRSAVAKPKPRSASSTTQSRNPSNAVSKRPGGRPPAAVVDSNPDYEDESRYERRAAKRHAREERRAMRQRRSDKHSNRRHRVRDIFEDPPRP
jgi:type IV secretory pathway VirB10-like protein